VSSRRKQDRRLAKDKTYARLREIHERNTREGLPGTEEASRTTLSQPLGTVSPAYRGKVSRRAASEEMR
jgi:hypothetical protein